MEGNSYEPTLKIGVIVGGGTGMELTQIFKDFLQTLVDNYSEKAVTFVEDTLSNDIPYIYHSYQTLKDGIGDDPKSAKEISDKEASRMAKLAQQWYKDGVNVIFRTAINAEALYTFRQHVKAIKVFGLETITGTKIIFVRDQAGGYYANTGYSLSEDGGELLVNTKFTKKHIQRLVNFGIKIAQESFGDKHDFKKWAIYKFHLFGNILESWVTESNPEFMAYQPDTGSTNLYKLISEDRHHKRPNKLLIICSNEVGDLIFEPILGYINMGDEVKIDFFARNYYIEPPFEGNLVEYQTVHGSADDIQGKDRVMPYAVLRIAADIAEKHFGVAGIVTCLESIISKSKRKRLASTSSILEEVYLQIKTFHNEK